jgi:hypothetical protein
MMMMTSEEKLETVDFRAKYIPILNVNDEHHFRKISR